MKLTKSKLKQIIREEVEEALRQTAGGTPLDWRKGRSNPFSPDFWYGGSAVFPHDGPKVKPEPGWYDDKGGEVDLQSDDYADRLQQFTQSIDRSPEENQEKYQEWFQSRLAQGV